MLLNISLNKGYSQDNDSLSDNNAIYINTYSINGIFNIENIKKQNYLIEVISITGKVIYKNQTEALEDINQIDLSKHSKGIYLLKLTNDKESIVSKVVLE